LAINPKPLILYKNIHKAQIEKLGFTFSVYIAKKYGYEF